MKLINKYNTTIGFLKLENERLQEENKHLQDQLDIALKDYDLMQEENQLIKELLKKDNTGALILTLNKEHELENRINKAIDYIEIIENNLSYGIKTEDYSELLEILKG